MDTFLGLSSAAWTAIFTLGLLVVAVAAAWYAHRQWKIGRDQVADARRAEAERLRPYVIVTVEPSAATRQLFDLVIRNIGVRPARNVHVTLDPPPRRARETRFELSKAKMLTEPITQIAPSQEFRAFYDNYRERNGRDDLPTSHVVTLVYSDSFGKEYREESVIDIDAQKGTNYVDVLTLHDLVKTLQGIGKILEHSSVLGKSGSLNVEAAIETWNEREMRLEQEEIERQEDYERTKAWFQENVKVEADRADTDDEGDSSTTT